MYKSTVDHAKEIRQEFKKRGIKASVRSNYFSMGSDIRITVKDLTPLSIVNEIAKNHERIERCQITGEILSGCNRYLIVQYGTDVRLTQELLQLIETAISNIGFSRGISYYQKQEILINVLTETGTFKKEDWQAYLRLALDHNPGLRKVLEKN